MKRLIAALCAPIIILMCSAAAYALDIDGLYLNDRELDYTTDPGGLVLIPARELFEGAGFTVQWFGDEGRMTAYNSELSVSAFKDSNYVYINKTFYNVSEKSGIRDGCFAVSLPAAILSLDASVSYSGRDLHLTSSRVESSDGWQYEVFDLVNGIRERNGLRRLVWNADLTRAARLHCEDMIARGYFSHNTPDGETPFTRMRRLGIRYTEAAENIAAGQPDPESVVKSWMASEGHRENILNPSLKEIGIAFARGGSYGIYWAQEFAATY